MYKHKNPVRGEANIALLGFFSLLLLFGIPVFMWQENNSFVGGLSNVRVEQVDLLSATTNYNSGPTSGQGSNYSSGSGYSNPSPSTKSTNTGPTSGQGSNYSSQSGYSNTNNTSNTTNSRPSGTGGGGGTAPNTNAGTPRNQTTGQQPGTGGCTGGGCGGSSPSGAGGTGPGGSGGIRNTTNPSNPNTQTPSNPSGTGGGSTAPNTNAGTPRNQTTGQQPGTGGCTGGGCPSSAQQQSVQNIQNQLNDFLDAAVNAVRNFFTTTPPEGYFDEYFNDPLKNIPPGYVPSFEVRTELSTLPPGTFTPDIPLTKAELEKIAKVVIAEVGALDSDLAIQAAAEVIKQRMLATGQSVDQILNANNFQVVANGSYKKVPTTGEAFETAENIVSNVLSGKVPQQTMDLFGNPYTHFSNVSLTIKQVVSGQTKPKTAQNNIEMKNNPNSLTIQGPRAGLETTFGQIEDINYVGPFTLRDDDATYFGSSLNSNLPSANNPSGSSGGTAPNTNAGTPRNQTTGAPPGTGGCTGGGCQLAKDLATYGEAVSNLRTVTTLSVGGKEVVTITENKQTGTISLSPEQPQTTRNGLAKFSYEGNVLNVNYVGGVATEISVTALPSSPTSPNSMVGNSNPNIQYGPGTGGTVTQYQGEGVPGGFGVVAFEGGPVAPSQPASNNEPYQGEGVPGGFGIVAFEGGPVTETGTIYGNSLIGNSNPEINYGAGTGGTPTQYPNSMLQTVSTQRQQELINQIDADAAQAKTDLYNDYVAPGISRVSNFFSGVGETIASLWGANSAPAATPKPIQGRITPESPEVGGQYEGATSGTTEIPKNNGGTPTQYPNSMVGNSNAEINYGAGTGANTANNVTNNTPNAPVSASVPPSTSGGVAISLFDNYVTAPIGQAFGYVAHGIESLGGDGTSSNPPVWCRWFGLSCP